MRTTLFITAGAFVVVAATTAAYRNAPPATVPVSVDPRCPVGRDSQAVISPWVIRIHQGDDVQWNVSANGAASDIAILPKNPQGWPFSSHRANGNRQNPAGASGMRGNANGRYSYSVQYVCRAGTPTADTVRIDPDVIIE